ncbi:hypothetical protein ACIRL3_24110 [Streptomyces sp. NPDC102384]|uniref:hypothetical protein n=1 Tax=Streptomyces sp. NPDC102384 TaxID=3366166 RepID=UPI00380A42B8
MSKSGTPASDEADRIPRSGAEIPSDVGGVFDARFRPVVATFAATVAEPGAALSIWHRGAEVVNVWRGVADARDGRTWDERTPRG